MPVMLFVEFFVAPDGSSPVEEYLDGLDAKQAAKVLWTLSAIKLTHPAPSVYLKRMVATDDLWEVRVIFAGNIFRLLGWMDGREKLILAHGFTKKTEKTPVQEIRTTETRKKIHENKEDR
jgi:phage-related protein